MRAVFEPGSQQSDWYKKREQSRVCLRCGRPGYRQGFSSEVLLAILQVSGRRPSRRKNVASVWVPSLIECSVPAVTVKTLKHFAFVGGRNAP